MPVRNITRWARNLENSKVEKYNLLRRIPTINEAKEGVPMYIMLGGILWQYIKFDKTLYRTRLEDPDNIVAPSSNEPASLSSPSNIDISK